MTRLEKLKQLIENDEKPVVYDMSNSGWDDVWTWGDIESLGFGKTGRTLNWHCDSLLLSRTYTGPNSIVLNPHNMVMSKGMIYSD